ncbi:hypothetical protein QOZ80_6AG0518440 [Eleusine coracana subsp. coracana]|nr:hypothetical protein QOZ80_6AG0518440 [Eleusine coracana subsp. coracana]
MLSPGPGDEFDGTKSDSIFSSELISGDEYASDDGGTPLPGGDEAIAEEEENLSPSRDAVDGRGKESSGELGSGGDVECPECGKFFRNDKSMFGHLRSHPNRGYKGATPPEKKPKLSSLGTDNDAGSPASASPDAIEGSLSQCSRRDPQLTPFEIFCACIMLTLGCRDNQSEQKVVPPPPSFTEGKVDAVEQTEVGIGGLVTSNVAAEVKKEDTGPEIGNALLCDNLDCSIVKIPKKRRRSISREDREAKKKLKLLTVTKEKRPYYMCKHCKAEFPTHQALGGHMAGHHREKKTPALNKEETSQAHQSMVSESKKGKQAKGDDESWRAGLSLLSKRMQVEKLSVASNMGWMSRQGPGGHMKLHFVRKKDGTPPVVTPVADDDDQRKPRLNIDLNVQAPEQD